MSLQLACPNCRHSLTPPDSLAVGEAITCTTCGLSFLYPGANIRPSAPETMVVPRSRFFPRRRAPSTPVSTGKRVVATVALVAGGMVTFIGVAILGFLWYRTMQIVSEHENPVQPGAPSQPAATQNPANRPPPRGMPEGDNPRRNRQSNRSDEAK